MRMALFVELHAINEPSGLGFLYDDTNSSIDGDSHRRLTIDDRVLSKENALPRRTG